MPWPIRTARALLPSMELHESAARTQTGAVTISRWKASVAFLYGPHIRLRQGRYRLTFQCEARNVRRHEQPIVGLEVIAQNRINCGWRDYTLAELEQGAATLDFEVSGDLAIEGGMDAPFEFRFVHLLNADLTISSVDLLESAGDDPRDAPAWEQRLLGLVRPPWARNERMHAVWLEMARRANIRLPALAWGSHLPWVVYPHLRLPNGFYRLELHCLAQSIREASNPLLRVEILTVPGDRLASHDFIADEMVNGYCGIEFEVPDELGLDKGENLQPQIKISHFGNASLTIDALCLRPVPVPQSPVRIAPRITTSRSRTNVVVVGNCQAGLLAEAFRCDEALNQKFRTKHHYMELPAKYHKQGKRDLVECGILLVQDIREWNAYPLRPLVPDTIPIVTFPCLRFASLWPFDAFNGPDDGEARRRDHPNFEFTYFDGLLGRLRKEITDLDSRFAAYQALDIDGVIDYRRIHKFEERRLSQMDSKFGGSIGAFILENFRRMRVFHTTGHPDGEVLGMLLRQITGALGVPYRPRQIAAPLNELGRLQVPVHPVVARALDVRWANETTKYLYRGEQITWESYVRKYIAYYG